MSQQDFPRYRGPRGWPALVKNVRLGWRLVRDPMVPAWTKLIPLGALLYVVLPGDLVPDVLIGLGQLDDLGVLLLALRTFIGMCPTQIVQQHLAQMSAVDGSYRVVDEEPPKPLSAGYLEDGTQIPVEETTPSTVEGTAKQIDQNP
jgi:uncharacterized membrane protein YkvA (DUF1232 family)